MKTMREDPSLTTGENIKIGIIIATKTKHTHRKEFLIYHFTRNEQGLVKVKENLNYQIIIANILFVITMSREGKGLAKVEEEEEVGETWDSKLTFILATVGLVFIFILFIGFSTSDSLLLGRFSFSYF